MVGLVAVIEEDFHDHARWPCPRRYALGSAVVGSIEKNRHRAQSET